MQYMKLSGSQFQQTKGKKLREIQVLTVWFWVKIVTFF